MVRIGSDLSKQPQVVVALVSKRVGVVVKIATFTITAFAIV